MEPRRDDGDDPPQRWLTASPMSQPQWSPVVTTGTTPLLEQSFGAGVVAAMEPRRDDGDDMLRASCQGCRLMCRNGAPS